MASKTTSLSAAALFLILNLLFSTLVVSQLDPACPRDALKLGVCANVLTALLNVELGSPPMEPCCPLILGLLDLEAGACLCTAIKANVLGVINLINVPVYLTLLLNYCGSKVPTGFQCA